MKVHYIAPSIIPSRAANAVHVVQQCAALHQEGAEVALYAKRSMKDPQYLPAALQESYGLPPGCLQLVTCYTARSLADTLQIALMALPSTWNGRPDETVLSRNLYAAYSLAVIRSRPLLFETHHLENGFRALLQRQVITRPWVTTVVISRQLIDCLKEHHGVAPTNTLVLPDAAPAGIEPLDPGARRATLGVLTGLDLSGFAFTCGYFGQLYSGRGIEIIEAMAGQRPDCIFLIYGGSDAEVARRRQANQLANLHYLGHVPHPVARQIMLAVDSLLMPYQPRVSIGIADHDTARWMSPMKMFEYLASGVPIISSDLPVLREILDDGRNCLLAQPDQVGSWLKALDRLRQDTTFAADLGRAAHVQYRERHTWNRRATALLQTAKDI